MILDNQNIYEVLKERIVTGGYKPATQLKESILAHEFNVSRSPIRAAISQLEQDGLVIKEKGKGAKVASWTRWDIDEIFQIRMQLEPFATQLAAERITEDELAHLIRINHLMDQTLKETSADQSFIAEQSEQANLLFHQTILKACRSDRLSSILKDMIKMPILSNSFYRFNISEIKQSLYQHLEITTALQNKQPYIARKAMELHLLTSYQRFFKTFKQESD